MTSFCSKIDTLIADTDRILNLYRCAECHGSGRVPIPAYVRAISLSNAETWECLTCAGKGYADDQR